MTPVALGWAGDPSFRSPMAVTVICGLMASTALSLFVVPVVFTLIDDAQVRLLQAPRQLMQRLAEWLTRTRKTAG